MDTWLIDGALWVESPHGSNPDALGRVDWCLRKLALWLAIVSIPAVSFPIGAVCQSHFGNQPWGLLMVPAQFFCVFATMAAAIRGYRGVLTDWGAVRPAHLTSVSGPFTSAAMSVRFCRGTS